jgi:hypothetical protein
VQSDQFSVKLDRSRTGGESENGRSTLVLAPTNEPSKRSRYQANSVIGTLKYGRSDAFVLLGFRREAIHGEKVNLDNFSPRARGRVGNRVFSVSTVLSGIQG